MIQDSINRISYAGNGVATEFAFPFSITTTNDVKVMLVDADGTETILTNDYTVDDVNSKVTYPGYPAGEEPPLEDQPPILAEGQRIVIYRELEITQLTSLFSQYPFKTIEAMIDKTTILLQQLKDAQQRALTLSVSTDTAVSSALPAPSALKSFRWNSAGTALETTIDPATVVSAATVEKNAAQAARLASEAAQAESQRIQTEIEQEVDNVALSAVATIQADITSSKNAAALSEINAATSETNAANSKDAAATSETNAASSANAANLSAQSTSDIAFTTLALMNADLAHDANVTALVTNDPTSTNNGIYIKLGASGTGSWQKSAYIPPVADGSVTTAKRTVLGEKGILFSAKPVNFDFTNKQIIFPTSVTYLAHRSSEYSIAANTTLNIVGNYNSYLYYNTATNSLVSVSTPTSNEGYILICNIRVDQKKVFGIDNYNINGTPVTNTHRRWGVIFGKYPINFDFVNSKLVFNTTGSSYSVIYENTDRQLVADGTSYELSLATTNTYDMACIVFDILTNTLVVKSNPTYLITTDILIAVYRRDAKKVWTLCNYEVNGVYDNLNTEVIEMLDPLTKAGLDDYVAKIINADVDGFRFMFFTDCHNRADRVNFYKIRAAKHFLKYGIVDACLVGGDISTETTSRLTNLKLQAQTVNELSDGYTNKPILIAKGNHDTAIYGSAPWDPTRFISNKMWHKNTLRQLKGLASFDSANPYSSYYYVDFEQDKIRVICIDTVNPPVIINDVVAYNPVESLFIDQAQVNWLISDALNFTSKTDRADWGVLFFSHVSPSASMQQNIKNAAAVEYLLKAFKDGAAINQSYPYVSDNNFDLTITADFTTQGAMDCICFINGHGHWDYDAVDAISGIRHIAVAGTDTYYPPTYPEGAVLPTRTDNTLTAHAFDTFTIDRTNRKIYTHRFGAGSDRVITY